MDEIDLSLFKDPELSCPNIPFLEPPLIVPSMNDFNALSSQLDELIVDINTQHLRSKLEKTKRQRLNSMIKNIEREIALLSKTVTQTQANITILKQQVESLIQMRSGDLAQLTTITYRCLCECTILSFPHSPTLS